MKRLFTFFLSFLFLGAMAQEITVSEAVTLRSDATYEIIGKLKGKTLMLIDRVTEFELVAFNDKMNKAFTKNLELEKRLPKIQHIVSPDNESFVLFYTHRQKNHLLLKALRYNDTGTGMDTVLVKDFGNKLSSFSTQAYHSQDKSKVLFYEVEFGKIKDIFVFDLDTMELLWEDNFGEIELNSSQELDQIVIDNTGNVYLIISKDNFPSKSKFHYFEIFTRNVSKKNLTIDKVELDGLLTYDNYFEFDNLNQKLVAGGLYSEKSRGKAQGYYYLSIPKGNAEQRTFSYYPFDIEFTEEFLDKPNSKNTHIDDTEVNEILFRRDGGILMIGERRKRSNRNSTTSSTYFNRDYRSGQDYFYNNMFIYSIHPTGDLHWEQVLHKKQYSYDDEGAYSSYFLLKMPESIHLIFNDDIKIENTVSEYLIKGNGAVERRSILNTEDKDLQLQFKDAIQISSREMLVASERRNKLRLVKLSF